MRSLVIVQLCQSEHHVNRNAGPDSELTDLGMTNLGLNDSMTVHILLRQD